jgi:hypothetical protein
MQEAAAVRSALRDFEISRISAPDKPGHDSILCSYYCN